jgi:hypothetical protein
MEELYQLHAKQPGFYNVAAVRYRGLENLATRADDVTGDPLAYPVIPVCF